MIDKLLILGGLIVGTNYVKSLPSLAFQNYNAFNEQIAQASQKHGVPYLLIKAVIATESGFRPDARATTTSARGLMQMTKGACQDVGADWSKMDNPAIAIDAGTAYLARMIKATGSYTHGVRAYYEGIGNRLRNMDDNPNNDNAQRARESAVYLEKVTSYQMAMRIYG